MEEFNLHLANILFYAFHTLLILFNVFGWIFPRTRKLNLITLLITFASWFLLGIWKGWGYCFLTDWHYDILRKLGKTDLPNSYISFLINQFSGYSPNAQLVEYSTIIVTVLALIFSVWVNFRGKKRVFNRK